MKKKLKFILPIVCILVVIVTFALLFYMKSKVEQVSSKNNIDNENIVNENIVSENIIDENTINNGIIEGENVVVDNTTPTENSVQDEVISSDEDRYSENRQKKAIELVEKHWGDDDTVYFTNEGINSDEEYVVAVRLKTSTAVKHYFKVNIETEKIEIDY